MHNNTFEQEIQRLLASIERQPEQGPDTETDTETSEEQEPETQLSEQEDTDGIQDMYVLVI